MKPCAEKKEAIAMLATDALTASEAVAVRRHLEECPACHTYAAQLTAVSTRLTEPAASSAAIQPPPGFHARLKHRIQSEGRTTSPASIFETLGALFTLPRLASASALLAVALGLALWMRLDKGSVGHRTIQAVQTPRDTGNGKSVGPSSGSTLMAYQAAFNRSFEDFDALVAQNAARTSTAEGMPMRSGAASF